MSTNSHDDPVAMEKAAKPSHVRAFKDQLPTFKEFASNEWKDILGLIIATAFSQAMNASPPIARRNFMLPSDPADVLAYSWPYREQIITVAVSAVLASVLPIVIFVLAQIRIKSYADLHASIYGILTTLVNGTFMQCILKTFVGGIRPYFYDACKPRADWVPGSGTGYGGNTFTTDICTGDTKHINKALTSWPSGHSNAAMGSMLFLALYLNAKLKIFADTRGRYWKMFVFFLPLLFGATICGTLLFDHTHHYYDIMTGAIIGMLNALAAYRMRYAAIFDFRFNHIPLPKSTYVTREQVEDTLATSASASESTRKSHKFGKRSAAKSRVVRHAQRFTYDVRAIEEATRHGALPFSHGAEPSSTPRGLGQHHHEQHKSSWHTPGVGSAPAHPQFNPVLTRRWQGPAVGAPEDAAWGQTMESGLSHFGTAHSAHEYGRGPRGTNGKVVNGHESVLPTTNGHTSAQVTQ